jgi:DNA helicase-2/ATP-dependent DNA helicase PcrA
VRSANRVIVASAGSGKTTTIIDDACAAAPARAALVTYTTNNTAAIELQFYRKLGYIPLHLSITTWYSFLLKHLIRPYQRSLYPRPVKKIHFQPGISVQFSRESDVAMHYFTTDSSIYVDKVSKFACQVVAKTSGKPIRRLEEIFDHIYIDEVQDLAGWDLDLVEILMRSRIGVTLVGDHRQATYSTNSAHKNKQYAGAKIILKFEEWKKARLCNLDYQNISHRCVQPICDFADRLHPALPNTRSLNTTVTGHDGIFAVKERDVLGYIAKFSPQTLRYSRADRGVPGSPMNYGAAKGLTFERTLIFPNKKVKKFLLTGKPDDAGDIAKLYVAITRARQSSAFVIADGAPSPFMAIYEAAGGSVHETLEPFVIGR